MSTPNQSSSSYDRPALLKAFDDTKSGVKGLTDSGIQKVPQIFIRPQDELAEERTYVQSNLQVPVIDLSAFQGSGREEIVEQVKRASKALGFFQVVNHGIAKDVLDGMLDGTRKFHEQEAEVKKAFHSREMMRRVKYSSNLDLYKSRAANWRDTLTISMTNDDGIDPEELPEICRDSTIDYIDQVTKLGRTLLGLLSEALGLKPDHLGSMECIQSRTFVAHYYPPCPEPELTLGTTKHTDPAFLTILLQDQIGGLQVLHENQYIDIHPVAGSLVINIGDMFQIISNDEFISADHRVLANRAGPRISVACFLTGASTTEKIYAPIRELISETNPIRYKEFTVREYMSKFFGRPLDKSGVDEFKLQD